ncbi:hypothetical protein Hanom_Chr10g00875501 [Helianthus anomalus]
MDLFLASTADIKRVAVIELESMIVNTFNVEFASIIFKISSALSNLPIFAILLNKYTPSKLKQSNKLHMNQFLIQTTQSL